MQLHSDITTWIYFPCDMI